MNKTKFQFFGKVNKLRKLLIGWPREKKTKQDSNYKIRNERRENTMEIKVIY